MTYARPGLGLVWAQYGPYHSARAAALIKLSGAFDVHAIEIASCTREYRWGKSVAQVDLISLCPGRVTEEVPFLTVFFAAHRQLSRLGLSACLLPSYSPKQSLAVLLAAKALRIKAVMMSESHARTARASGVLHLVKRWLVGLFDSALVGGKPHQRYLASLGLPAEKIFTGYDAVENEYFAHEAHKIRSHSTALRDRYELPEHYFLSLGRFVAKKNLATLIRAYREFLNSSPLNKTHLVMVGSGEEEAGLKLSCQEFGLPVYDKTAIKGRCIDCGIRETETANRKSEIANSDPGVHFYGFRQIDENPVFYALADAFILPSVCEEWGLVVNEAMASSLPVVVSEAVGCAEDLLEIGMPESISTEAVSRLTEFRLSDRIRQNGFAFDANSSNELSRVLNFLESFPETRSAMGRASRQIIEKFSCENFARNCLRAATIALEH